MANSDVLVRMKADTQNYNSNIAKARRQLEQFKNDNLTAGGAIKQLSSSALSAVSGFASITAAVGAFTAAVGSNIETARNFEKSMSQLSSLTGMVGEDLNQLKEYAIELGASTTLSASQVADAFKMIGSQQPQLLESAEALKQVTKYAITLSEAAGIDLATASQTLSTSINQMGGDSNNAARYINVLAAASQKGAGDIAWLGEAITKSATAAKAVGTDYEELVANLEQLAKAGFDASTAGTALRSIIMNLEKQAKNEFKPSIVGLTQAFENLGKANLSIAEYQQIAGKMFASQAMALANAAEEAKNMREQITDTNTAEEQARINTDNLDGSLKQLSSAWEGFNLHLNSSNGFLRTCVDWLKDVVVWLDNTFTAAGRASSALAKLQGGGNGKPTRTESMLNLLGTVSDGKKDSLYNRQVSEFYKYINKKDREIRAQEKKFDELDTTTDPTGAISMSINSKIDKLKTQIEAAKKMLKEYQAGAKVILEGGSAISNTTGNGGTDGSVAADKKTKKTKTQQTELQQNQKKINDLQQQYVEIASNGANLDDERLVKLREEIDLLNKRNEQLKFYAENAQGRLLPRNLGTDTTGISQIPNGGVVPIAQSLKTDFKIDEKSLRKVQTAIEKQANEQIKQDSKDTKSVAEGVGMLGNGMTNFVKGLDALGLDLGEGFDSVISGIMAVTSILSGISTILLAIEAIAGADAIIPLAHGGIVPHAAGGYMIGGNSFSGDNIFAGGAWVNSGELVLNKSQQSTLASRLNDGGITNIKLSAVVRGNQLLLVQNNDSRIAGKGTIMRTNSKH